MTPPSDGRLAAVLGATLPALVFCDVCHVLFFLIQCFDVFCVLLICDGFFVEGSLKNVFVNTF